jgi:hypothetical protein
VMIKVPRRQMRLAGALLYGAPFLAPSGMRY